MDRYEAYHIKVLEVVIKIHSNSTEFYTYFHDAASSSICVSVSEIKVELVHIEQAPCGQL